VFDLGENCQAVHMDLQSKSKQLNTSYDIVW